ncbi:hypothetical protein OK18_18465 [Chryseobacterium gallinarum]|uniref:Lanthionine synthetase C family protein n=1 Tax=Chryseobacterium gallinarum TaxID=1324352 RepID=A0A0G3MB60_CHRGL|nr:lanthionine synthetase C family protein [Chryseobacterium gallinarum]AKK74322.1 hypothetical protein OK18_18465 [Chryseobacterium gallinarum]
MEKTISIIGGKQNEINEILSSIAQTIINKSKSPGPDLGLLSGTMGEILFLHEYSKINNKYKQYIPENLDCLFESIEYGNVYHTYCSGLAGICLGIDYIESEKNTAYEHFDFIDDQIDAWLAGQLNKCINEGNYDFLHGAIGIGFYFLERFKAGNDRSEKALHHLLQFLNDTAIKEKDLIKWKNHKQKVNISLSHGMSSIIIFLLELYISGFRSEYDVKRLIEGGISFILKQEINPDVYHSYFPYTSVEEETDEIKGSRLAWCYGDLGVAVMLGKASGIFNNSIWKRKSAEIMEFSAARRTDDKIRILDAGICHGSAGVSLIFYNEFLKTGNEKYAVAAKFWLNKTLEYYKEDPDHFSRVSYNPVTEEYYPNNSLLEGSAGVGLALLTIMEDTSDWSKFLLI